MTLGELLTLLREGILNDRTDRIAGTSDYLWTDQTLVTYIAEAQRKFAVETLILRDARTPEVTAITLVPGQRDYPLHPAVIAVLSAKNAAQQSDLLRVGHAVLAAYRAPTEQWVDPSHYVHMQPGPAVAYATDEGLEEVGGSTSGISLRIYPTPRAEEAGRVVQLRVVRKPIGVLNPLEPTATLEIPEDHHIEILDYAAYLALRIVDDDAGAPKRAEEFRQMFEVNAKKARALAMRKMFAPLGWGFGRGGFTWDR